MENFIKIYNNSGNIVFNRDQIVTVETSDFKDESIFRISIETTTTRKILSWEREDFGEEARELRNDAFKALTGIEVDD